MAGTWCARRCFSLVLTLCLVVLGTSLAGAAEWGAIVPGKTTMESVRAQYGPPTRQEGVKLEGYDTTSWIYEGEQAPRGMRRLTVEFGLLTPEGYRPQVVRLFELEPRPGIFTRQTVLAGWGPPTKVGEHEGAPVFFYQAGLLVEFDKEGWLALRMTFTPPQPEQ